MSEEKNEDEQDNGGVQKGRLAIAVLGLFFAGVGSVLYGLLANLVFGAEIWKAHVLKNFEMISGLPMAAALAFGIVVIFQNNTKGPVSVKVVGLELKGPAGPILLWAICFLVIVTGIAITSNNI